MAERPEASMDFSLKFEYGRWRLKRPGDGYNEGRSLTPDEAIVIAGVLGHEHVEDVKIVLREEAAYRREEHAKAVEYERRDRKSRKKARRDAWRAVQDADAALQRLDRGFQ